MSGLHVPWPGRRFAIISASVLALLAVLLFAVAWYYSGLIESGLLKPDYSPQELNLRVVRVGDARIVLTEREGGQVESIDDDELWGLEGESGYGQVGDIVGESGGEVTREFSLLSGTFEPGDYARLDSLAFRGDPSSARGIDFREVAVPSPLGGLPAWRVDGGAGAWVIFVHGWRSDREEALRVLPAVSSLGLTSLVMTYRNDEGAPRSPDGRIRWGETEWEDVEAAVQYALAEGAGSIVLYGYSMGGGIVLRFLEESELAPSVKAVVLDSPALDFGALVDFQAERRHVPRFLTSLAKRFASWRFDVDWGATDHLAHAERVEAPILLFHGDDDDRAPIEVSERLAAERTDIVTLVVGRGAGHVRTWNVGPEAYETRVKGFLTAAIGGSPLGAEWRIIDATITARE
jgi:pimeloyl-ACP methyl ester carboxylesterase